MKFYHFKKESEIKNLIKWHNSNSDFVVLDLETTGLDVKKDRVVSVQMSGKSPDSAVFFDGKFLPLLKDLKVTQVGQNWIGYDWKIAYYNGVDLRTENVRDTRIMDHLIDENRSHSLDPWIQERFGDTYKEDFWAKYKSFEDAPLDEQLEYSCKDIVYTHARYIDLLAELEEQEIPEHVVEHQHLLALALLDTELKGIKVDLDYTVQLGLELKTDIIATEKKLREMGGFACEQVELDLWATEITKAYRPKGNKWKTLPKPAFNFNSSDHVKALFYEHFNLPVQVDPKTKRPTVAKAALDELEYLHPIVPPLKELRTKSKMYSTFVEGILQKAEDGRIYPEFNVNGTKTLRISHANPNMAQSPSRGEWVKTRGIFIPEEGNVLGTADYSQLEVCIAAHYSGDKSLLRIIHEGASQHDITAEGLGIPRSTAKTLNFAMQYLCSPFKVAQILGCSQKEAENVWNKYWETYSGLKKFIDETIAEMESQLYVTTLFGTRRRFNTYRRPRWCDPEKGIYCKPMRQAFNAKIQGTGGLMMSYAFGRTYKTFQERKLGRTWFTVHDEGLIETPPSKFEQGMNVLTSNMLKMKDELGLTVPLSVSPSEALQRWQK